MGLRAKILVVDETTSQIDHTVNLAELVDQVDSQQSQLSHVNKRKEYRLKKTKKSETVSENQKNLRNNKVPIIPNNAWTIPCYICTG